MRFDVSGQLWASLETINFVVLRNIGTGGALVEARLPPGIRIPRSAQVAFGQQGPDVTAIIRHVSPLVQDEDSNLCLVGLEFVNLSPVKREGLEQFIRDWSGLAES